VETSTVCSQRLSNAVNKMQEKLRSSVSISVSQPTYEIRSKSAYLVSAVCDVTQYVNEATDSVGRLVVSLMQADACSEHQPGEHARLLNGNGESELEEGEDVVAEDNQNEADLNAGDEEMIDISLGVEFLCNEDSDDEEGQANNGRKRKQERENKSPPTSPSSSPSKRARRVVGRRSLPNEALRPPPLYQPPSVLKLLEKKKKVVRSNGLYQFVLWREAVRANRSEEVTSEEPSERPSEIQREEDNETEEEEAEDEEHAAPNVIVQNITI